MYENDIIEFSDNGFNHYLHHFDECDGDLEFNEELGCLQMAADCIEEILWT